MVGHLGKKNNMTRGQLLPQRQCKRREESNIQRQLHKQFPLFSSKIVARRTECHSASVGITLLYGNMTIYTIHTPAPSLYKMQETKPVLITSFYVLVFWST